ncbi:acyltransferase [Amylibacter sp.]|nr:acyltransferase [Amylibacter sp.]
MKYRPEIDGLRALAVVPVIFFHAGFELFSGGFVGVDVFFVISGYLITTILIEDIENKRFSIVDFYERRARRILPALFSVMLVCIPFTWMWMVPGQMKDFSESLFSVSVFISNLYFMSQAGYFAPSVELNPLIHTWSLSVEEQFYLFFPPILLLFFKRSGRFALIGIISICILSFFFSEWGWRENIERNFFFSLSRFWELLAGSIAAFIVQKQGVQKNNPLALLGLSAIVFSIFFYDQSTPFPSIYALVPVLGVVLLVLYADKGTLAAKLLSTKILVGIGLISYSAYLWHQPLFAFARIRLLDYPSSILMLILSMLSLLFAYLSWMFVEKPFRGKFFKQKNIFILSVSGFLVFMVIGIAGHKTEGFYERSVFQSIRKYELTLSEAYSGFRHCKSHPYFIKGVDGKICLVGDLSKKPIGLLWGDSYAGSALHGIDNFLRSEGKSYIAILSDGCPPIPGISREHNAFNCNAKRHNDVLSWFVNQSEVNELIWVGRFRSVISKLEGNQFYLNGSKLSLSILENKIKQTSNTLTNNGKRFVFVIEGPNFPVSVPNYLSKATFLNLEINPDTSLISVDVTEQRREIGISPFFFNSIDGALYVDSISLFCGTNTCNGVMANGNPLVVDSGHISHSASEKLAAEIFRLLGY